MYKVRFKSSPNEGKDGEGNRELLLLLLQAAKKNKNLVDFGPWLGMLTI
jgi:hypothetical protein